MKNVVLFASIAMASGLLLTNVYNSLVDARAWGAEIPGSIETVRQYYKSINPGDFFRVFSPINQVLALLTVILFWKAFPSARLYVCGALLFYIITDVFTFGYFYPRNEIMFKTDISKVAEIKAAWLQWSTMNWVRSAILMVGVVFSFVSLHKIYMARAGQLQ